MDQGEVTVRVLWVHIVPEAMLFPGVPEQDTLPYFDFFARLGNNFSSISPGLCTL
jgi:hypothetical protein